eukprot:CAMPEP_0204023186 /NCGR_PEP_ID=MMETSP0360-20130528/33994_1 /ASSEMBLY_ACC=CAM_ASM_000342 /TAXON_ID=268821 /ORGANISM="Scrippsiella Hangoei, Strain SHTV-5" /LENGTH=42 /DNA_ID= /DNA_START= /DNA_END= /DNA_ORIENTATION=
MCNVPSTIDGLAGSGSLSLDCMDGGSTMPLRSSSDTIADTDG